jgi:hypothetical protein
MGQNYIIRRHVMDEVGVDLGDLIAGHIVGVPGVIGA